MKFEHSVIMICTAIVSSSFTIAAVRYCDSLRSAPRAERMQSVVSDPNPGFQRHTALRLRPEKTSHDTATNRVEGNSR